MYGSLLVIAMLATIEVRPIAAAPASINLGVLSFPSSHSRNCQAVSFADPDDVRPVVRQPIKKRHDLGAVAGLGGQP